MTSDPTNDVVVVGVDGCPGGSWVAVSGRVNKGRRVRRLRVEVVSDLEPIVRRLRRHEIAAIAIDMPIGLLESTSRTADIAARKLLGPRRASVFPTPLRVVLDAEDYADACARSRAVSGKALSKQAFNLVDKIRALDALIHPADQDRLVEAHPELAFARLNRGPVPFSKHEHEGRALRRELLATELTDTDLGRVLGSGAAPLLDLLDATSLVTTAARVATGQEIRLGNDKDATGKRAEVVY